MALANSKKHPNQPRRRLPQLLVASVGLVVALLCSRVFVAEGEHLLRHSQAPPVYVIQHEHHRLHQPGLVQSRQSWAAWNNQKWTIASHHRHENSVPVDDGDQPQLGPDESAPNHEVPAASSRDFAAEPDHLVQQHYSRDEQTPDGNYYADNQSPWSISSTWAGAQSQSQSRLESTGTKGGWSGGTGSRAGSRPRRRPNSTKSTPNGPRHSTKGQRRNHLPKRPVPTNPGRGDDHLTPNSTTTTTTTRPIVTQNRRAGSQNNNNKKKIVCYYGSWAVYRPDAGKFPVENIDPFLCTHIIYGFTGLSYDGLIKPLDPWNDLEDNYGKGAFKRFTNLKRINPDLKALIAIGGWNEGSIKYSKMASEPEARVRFVRSVVDFLQAYNFDGLDLDWEYPGARGGFSYDKQNFVKLLRELHDAFQPHGYLLTAAVSAGKWFVDPAYDIPQVSKYLDLINLMAYDYHGGWETKTGMNAPLFHSARHDSRDEALLNVNWSVNYWLQQGAPAEKIMLGVGSYGRSFTLDKANVNGINAPASQKGQAGPYTREPGSLGYNEICDSFQRQPNAWTIVRDPDYLAPYAFNDRQWVGYDDMESLALKTRYAKSMGLGGMMMWSIETDDFLGRCHNEKYPLLNTIKRVLDGGPGPSPTKPPVSTSSTTTRKPVYVSSTSTTTRRPAPVTPTRPDIEIEDDLPGSSPRPPVVISTTSTTTTRRPKPVRPTTSTTTTTTMRPQIGAEFTCRADGMFSDPSNCRKFIRCVGSPSGRFQVYKFDCGPGTAFNEQQQYCDHIYNVPSCSTASPASPASLAPSAPVASSSIVSREQIYHNVLLPQFYGQYFESY